MEQDSPAASASLPVDSTVIGARSGTGRVARASPTLDSPGQRTLGATLVLGGGISNQFGAALGALAFPAIGPIGVVAIRQIVTAIVLVPVARPRFRAYRREQWLPVLGLALVFSIMNLTLYSAVERIGLGLAVTLEFLGPLSVALIGSRRLLDLACAILAGAGVIVLARPGPTSDVIGIGLGLIAAACWAMYILLNRSLARYLPGFEGAAAASAVASALWIPVAVCWFLTHPPTASALMLAVACGVLSSALPYAVDNLALRRVPAPLFGILTSTSPMWAAFAGWVMLGERLSINEWIGIGLVVGGSAIATSMGIRGARKRVAGAHVHADATTNTNRP